MAKGQTTTISQKVNNKPTVTVTKTVELIVVNGALAPDPKELEPGVNSVNQ